MDLALILALSGLVLLILLVIGVWSILFIAVGSFKRVENLLQQIIFFATPQDESAPGTKAITLENDSVSQMAAAPVLDARKTGMVTVEMGNDAAEVQKPASENVAVPIVADAESFDFEKAVAAGVDQTIQVSEEPDASEGQIEKTMKWDRKDLLGLASKSEAIVVEGSEIKMPAGMTIKKTKEQENAPVAQPEKSKNDESIISGEDLVDKLDSFFGGLEDKK